MSVAADGTNLTPQPLPGSAVRVQLPDGQLLPTTYASDGDHLTDLLNGVYYLPVPALASRRGLRKAPRPYRADQELDAAVG